MVRGLVQKSFLSIALFCLSLALHIVFLISLSGKNISNAPNVAQQMIVVANLDPLRTSLDLDSSFENLKPDAILSDAKPLVEEKSTETLVYKLRAGGTEVSPDYDPNKIYYFPVNDLTQKPVLPEEMVPDLVLVPNKDFPQPLVVSLLINEKGEIDQLVFPPKLPEAVQQQINTVFAKLRFMPGSIEGVIVKSRLDVQIMVETDLLPVNR